MKDPSLMRSSVKKFKQSKEDTLNNDLDRASSVNPIWNTPKMREILKQYIPLADMILDQEFFQSKTMREFRPSLTMEEFYGNCSKLIKIIKGEP